MKLITKTFVSLGMILSFDNKFAQAFPKEVKENARLVDVSGELKIGPDKNTFMKIWRRLMKKRNYL